jgi:Cu2+-exporting ATPase
MRCAGCIAKIERGLVQFPGISAARVNLSSKRVTISHNESFDDNELIEALHNLGFEAHSAVDQIAVSDDHHRKALLRALAVAGFGMMNIMLLSVSIWSGADGVTRDLFHWLSALIAIPVVAYAGRPFFASALTAVRHKRTNMDVPISIGVLLATGLSIYETVRGGAHAYFDGAVMLLFFLLAGRALDASMRGHTRAGIGALLGRMGKSASVLQGDGTIRRVPAEEIAVGATMIVAAGEALAADGTVELGSSAVDNSMITGESSPEPVEASDKVLAGAINMLGPIRVRVTAVAEDTAIAEIARLMDEAGQSRGRYVRIADRVSRLYAPAVHTLAALALAGWLLAGAGWYQSLVIAIAVLIITCPCAMGLAVPAAQVVATGTLIKQGVLVKDGSALERLAEVDTVFFDKTGTLTIGEPVPDLSALSQDEKAIALGLAQASRHPMSVGLTKALKREGVLPAHLDELHELAGLGIEGKHRNKIVALRKPEVRNSGTACALMTGSNVVTIRFADPLRVDARETISRLIELGLQPAILSGDGARAVAVAAETLGMRGTAQLKPDEKLSLLQEIKSAGRRPLMIGDGLNDGPALAAAHASMAPGTASDASQQAADAVFIGERLMPVVSAVLVARRTMKIVRQNFGFAIGYNLIAVPLALAGLVTPLIAALAMSLSSLVVIANSLRLAKVSV